MTSIDYLPPPKISLLVYSPSTLPFATILSQLIAPAKIVLDKLAQDVILELAAVRNRPATYNQFVDLLAAIVNSWHIKDQATLLVSVPRIILNDRTTLSPKEQNVQDSTPGAVLRRLNILNSLYEECFPELRFITFVNGRSRAEIVPELESILGLKLPPPSASSAEPSLGSLRARAVKNVLGGKVWRTECERGIEAVWCKARDRVRTMGVQ